MEKRFLKEITIREMVFYLLQKWKIILAVCVLAGIIPMISAVRSGSTSNMPQERTYILQDGNYVYATLLNIRAESTTEVASSSSYLGLIISKSSITAAIEKLGLQESFIDIFNKMSWEIVGENIKLKISSPLQEIDGCSWEEILGAIADEGEERIKQYYDNVIDIRVIDEPYLENALTKIPDQSEDSQKISRPLIMGKKRILLSVMIGGVLSCAGLLVIFLLGENIMTEKEIEENMGIPVLAVVDKIRIDTNAVRR